MTLLFSYVIKYSYFIYLLYAERQGNKGYCMIFKVILPFSFEEKSNMKLFILHTLCMKVIKKIVWVFFVFIKIIIWFYTYLKRLFREEFMFLPDFDFVNIKM